MVYDGGAYEVTISIHAPRTGSDDARFHALAHVHISIHAPRTGSDKPCLLAQHQKADFNPRSPHGERRDFCRKSGRNQAFQSTLPARGATISDTFLSARRPISIHAPRTGSDTQAIGSKLLQVHFNPRSPHGERRYHSTLRASPIYFNPRSPHGERQPHIFWRFAHFVFQSTLPARGATRRVQRLPCRQRDFNPRSPHGERTRGGDERGGGMAFQSTLPARGATANVATTVGISVFQSTLPARGATS